MILRYRLVELLADGHFHSGEGLGQQLGVTRAAVWKQIKALSELGLDVHAVRGQGYRLASSFEPLRADSIRCSLPDAVAARLAGLDVLHEVDSTSDYLKRLPSSCTAAQGRACAAE